MLTTLLSWSKEQHSHLPWRTDRSLYVTLVSEIMLQQTTVSTVVNHIDRFLKIYPDIKTLAASNEDDVCIAWKGLGYYRRARNLLNAAKEIQEKFAGIIPVDVETLKTIKGIGDYTANAIVGIGANKKALAVDANLERVIARLYALETVKGPKLQKEIYQAFFAKEVLPEIKNGNARVINEALMDLGRVICQARKADCVICPIKKDCQSFEKSLVHKIPNVEKKKVEKFDLDLLRVVVEQRGRVLGYVKSEKQWLRGQVEIPTFVIATEDKKLIQYPALKKKISKAKKDALINFKTSITKYKIKNYILKLSKEEFENMGYDLSQYKFYLKNSEKSNFSTSSIKVFERL
ncbi:hypothetical protein A9Q84_19455 [Halobacteriovorax marinus]|uniref:Adenine DNA glycosylase n=1 Tax=Halobacteriovorax marinus TaxID=97084 RepID=A0A1Y5F2I2_9BACT|nr:hypothetical protein A9Q84_19455 [Halobacteriovorax marinus]